MIFQIKLFTVSETVISVFRFMIVFSSVRNPTNPICDGFQTQSRGLWGNEASSVAFRLGNNSVRKNHLLYHDRKHNLSRNRVLTSVWWVHSEYAQAGSMMKNGQPLSTQLSMRHKHCWISVQWQDKSPVLQWRYLLPANQAAHKYPTH